MTRSILIALFGLICMSTTCCPIKTKLHAVAVNTTGDQIRDTQQKVVIRMSAENDHWPQGSLFTVFVTIKNEGTDTLSIPAIPFELKTPGFDMTLMQDYGTANNSIVAPGDSTRKQWEYGNRFKGSYRSFYKQLSKADITIQPKQISAAGRELRFPVAHFVIDRPAE